MAKLNIMDKTDFINKLKKKFKFQVFEDPETGEPKQRMLNYTKIEQIIDEFAKEQSDGIDYKTNFNPKGK